MATASSALDAGPGGNQISVEVSEATTAAEDTFKLTVRAPGRPDEVYDDLSTKRGKNNVVTVVKEQSKLITDRGGRPGRASSARPHAVGSPWPAPRAPSRCA